MRYFIQFIFFTFITWPAAAGACTNPPGDAGDQIYNTTYNVMQYCNGTHWVAMGSHAQGGGDHLGNHTAGQALDMSGFRIENIGPPSASTDAASKAYVDAALSGSTPALSAVLAQGNAAGNRRITGLAAPTAAGDAATKQYVDARTLPACLEGETIVMGASVWQCRPAAGPCDGMEVEGACWILAAPATSCAAACANHGGYSEATRTYAGSSGSDGNCTTLLTGLLGLPLESFESSDECEATALGCMAVTGMADGTTVITAGLRCRMPATTAEAFYPSAPDGNGGYMHVRRVCACNSGPA